MIRIQLKYKGKFSAKVFEFSFLRRI